MPPKSKKTKVKRISKKKEDKKNDLSTLKLFFNLKVTTVDQLSTVLEDYPVGKEIFDRLRNKIIPRLEAWGIKAFIIPLPLSSDGHFWGDYAMPFIETVEKVDIGDSPYMYFAVKMGPEAEYVYSNLPIEIDFSPLSKDMKIKVAAMFFANFYTRYSWNGSNNVRMTISYDEIRKKQDKLKGIIFRDDDTFPRLYISIETNIDMTDNMDKLDHIITSVEQIYGPYVNWTNGTNDITFTLYVFDIEKNKRKFEALKEIFQNATYIKKCSFYYSTNSENEEMIWKK